MAMRSNPRGYGPSHNQAPPGPGPPCSPSALPLSAHQCPGHLCELKTNRAQWVHLNKQGGVSESAENQGESWDPCLLSGTPKPRIQRGCSISGLQESRPREEWPS